jgi:hypothetical protein
MSRSIILALFPFVASAAMLPDSVGVFHRVSAQPVAFQKQALPDEYGFQEGEEAQYEGDGQKFTATAYRFQDPTGALAAFEWMRPADSKPSGIAKVAVDWPDGSLLLEGNYVLKFVGYHPGAPLAAALVENLKQVDNSPLPPLLDYMPAENLVPGSERYILGPVSLAQFAPAIPPSTAAFHLGAEAQLGSYRGPGGEMQMALFEYPTPQIAMQQAPAFEKIPQAMVKRSGPLVAIVLSPPNADAAERLLAQVKYQATVTLDERVSTRRDNIGNLVINAFILIGILLGFSIVAGLAVGGVRAFLRRGQPAGEGEGMITLHLADHYKA